MEELNNVLGYKDLYIFQDCDFFSFTIDSIILANFVNIRLKDKLILDMCTGNGIVPIILSKRTNSNIIGVDIQKKLCDLSNKSVSYNNLDNVEIINEDIKNYSNNNLNRFDLVLCNPPYFKYDNNAKVSLSNEKMIARHEVMLNLEEVCICAKKLLKDNGNFALVHRPERLTEVINCFLSNNIMPKRIKFIYNKSNSEAFLFLIEGQKNAKHGLIVDSPLVLYNEDGSMSDDYIKLQEVINYESN